MSAKKAKKAAPKKSGRSVPDDDQIRAMAQARYGDEGALEIDDGAVVSISEDQKGPRGAYVQAWVWVDFPSEEDGPCEHNGTGWAGGVQVCTSCGKEL